MIAKLRAAPDALEKAVAGLTAEQLTAHYLPDEWSAAQNVHHVADAHIISFYRMKTMLVDTNPAIYPVIPDTWAALADADNADVASSLQLLKGLHARWARLFDSLNEAQWLRAAVRANGSTMTVEDVLRIYANHTYNHIEQINKTLAAAQ